MKLKSIVKVAVPCLVFCASCATLPTGSGPGCIDKNAVNYDPNAAYDNGSCVVIDQKCYSLFFEYASTADPNSDDVNFNSVLAANHGKVLALRVPIADAFSWPGNDSIVYWFETKYNGIGGTLPLYGCNDGFLAANYANANNSIAARYANTSPEGGIGTYFTVGGGINAGKLNINLYVKFFSPLSQYYAAVYVVNKNIVETQNVGGTLDTNFVQHHVVMATVTGVFGDPIPASEVGSNKVYHKGYVFPYTSIPNLNPNAIEVVGVLWRKTGTNWSMVNVTPNI